jgi:hypothetical protein
MYEVELDYEPEERSRIELTVNGETITIKREAQTVLPDVPVQTVDWDEFDIDVWENDEGYYTAFISIVIGDKKVTIDSSYQKLIPWVTVKNKEEGTTYCVTWEHHYSNLKEEMS